MDNRNIWLDGIMGVVVGDALGLPVQFSSREEVEEDPVTDMIGFGLFNMPPGSWSDDSSLTHGHLRAKIACSIYYFLVKNVLHHTGTLPERLQAGMDEALAGGLAGLYYGYDSIPEEWMEKIQKRYWIKRMCEVH